MVLRLSLSSHISHITSITRITSRLTLQSPLSIAITLQSLLFSTVKSASCHLNALVSPSRQTPPPPLPAQGPTPSTPATQPPSTLYLMSMQPPSVAPARPQNPPRPSTPSSQSPLLCHRPPTLVPASSTPLWHVIPNPPCLLRRRPCQTTNILSNPSLAP